MQQEREIEFKNMLTQEEYEKLLYLVFPEKHKHFVVQTNHYFDTIDHRLREQGAALRIRVADIYQELTLKVPDRDFLMETNIPLDKKETSKILSNQNLTLSSYIDSNTKLHLTDIKNDTIFHLFNSLTTKRIEKQVDIHTIVLDQTTFQNDGVDYELEVESEDEKLGQEFFDSLLEKYSIPSRPSIPKIARAQRNK